MKLNKKEEDLLLKNGWIVNYNPFSVVNQNTGCSFGHSFYCKIFLKEKLEELKEIEKPIEKISNEDILSHFGFYFLCESPIEISNSNNDLITGECALWLLSELRDEYHRNN